MSPRSEQKPALGQRSTSKKHTTLGPKPEPAIWSRDTGQRISWYDSCQLHIICMSNINDICCNPRLHNLVLAGWPPCCATSFVVVVVVVVVGRTRPWSMPLAILTKRKELHGQLHGFPFLCIHVVPFSIIMGLRFGPPDLRYKTTTETEKKPTWNRQVAMTREHGSSAEAKNCESSGRQILLFPTADRRFEKKVKCPTARASFWVKFPTVRSLTRVKCPGIAWGGGWAVLELTGT